jgi:hypothetical protein
MAYTTINKSTDYFNTKLYTGTGATQSITGVGFQPDFTWIKSRSDALSHALFDVVRGTTKVINSNLTGAEYTNTDTLTAFGTDGFTVGSNTGVNASGETRVSWNWLGANGTASNTDGSITSTVSANTTSGFSIVKYTGNGNNGATIGHGLGVVPKMILVKCTSNSENWRVYHHKLGATKYLQLNGTGAETTSNSMWYDTAPTSSVFSVGSSGTTNGSGETYIAYCFAEKTGYSKFGSYTGNGNADGTFVYTGFKPAMVLYKNSSSVADWLIYDTKRIHSGTQLDYLEPNTSDAEGFLAVDVLSNGFKVREASGAKFNASGDTYIYMAFAEAPLVGTNNVPCTAR